MTEWRTKATASWGFKSEKENDLKGREGKGIAKSSDPNRINNVSMD